MKKFLALIIVLAMALMSFSPIVGLVDEVSEATVNELDASKSEYTESIDKQDSDVEPDTAVKILVQVSGTPGLKKSASLEKAADYAKKNLAKLPEQIKRAEQKLGRSIEVEAEYGLLFNGFAFDGQYWMIEKLNELDGIFAFESVMFEVADVGSDAVTPAMSTSTGTIGAEDAWALGYTGAGTTIAVLDTGILRTHEAFSVMPEVTAIDVEYLETVLNEYGDLMHCGDDANQLYYNEKIPFNWDYWDYDYDPNHTASDHGTHVAGIVAGNNGGSFRGTAPDAQLVIMQISTSSGGIYTSTLFEALEDAVYLGVDSINMSLGSAAGFSKSSAGFAGMSEVLEVIDAAGISINAAAGNDTNNMIDTNFGDYAFSIYKTLSSNPDYGVVGYPASDIYSFAVGSIMNTPSDIGYLEFNGDRYFYGATTETVLGTIPGEYRLVYAGLGSVEEFAEHNFEGAIAIVQRGTLTFTDKCTNAANAGAVGVLLYNNASGPFTPTVSSTIPVGTLLMSEGEEIVGQLVDGEGTCTIVDSICYDSMKMATTSSWGTTADLLIKPEIAAPGGNVYSCVGFQGDTAYGNKSGTSMATPHVAAALSIIKQRLREVFPDATSDEINDLAYAFAMSTAKQVNGFVRQQGAGLINIYDAITTEVYLTVPGADRPKLEVGDSEEGTFTFTFTLNNIGEVDHTFAINIDALTEEVSVETYSGNWTHNSPSTEVNIINGTIKNVSNMIDTEGPATVTVPAGESITVSMTISVGEELWDYYNQHFPVGAFLEGWVKLTNVDEDGVDLAIPFLGYVGDWDEPSMLDRGYYWQEAVGEPNLEASFNSRYNMAGYGASQLMGLNRYWDMTGETYFADRNAISPNGDGVYDAFTYFQFVLLRSAKLITVNVEDEDGNIIENLYTQNYAAKDHYNLMVSSYYTTWHDIVMNFDGSYLDENETVNIVLETWLDHEGYTPEANESGRWVVPITKDTVAPAVQITEDGIRVVDENYVAYYAIYSDAELTDCIFETGAFGEERGIGYDYVTSDTHYFVAVADYAGNEEVYEVNNGVVSATGRTFSDNGRTIVAYRAENYDTGNCEHSWVSFKPELGTNVELAQLTDPDYTPLDYDFFASDSRYYDAAVDNNGDVYVVREDGKIMLLDPETFEETLVWQNTNPGFMLALNIAFDPETNECFAVCSFVNYEGEENGKKIVSLDLETGEYRVIADGDFSWGIEVLEPGRIVWFDRLTSLHIIDYEGNEVDCIVMPCQDSRGKTHHGVKGYTGDLLYDRENNRLYIGSRFSWLEYAKYDTGGIIEYDFNTNTYTIRRIGEGAGIVVMGMFFLDETTPTESVELDGYEISTNEVELKVFENMFVDFVRTPEDANDYELEWISSDESVATVRGNKRRANIMSQGVSGVSTVTCNIYVGGELIASEEIAVTVSADAELCAAANTEFGTLEFGSQNPYPFVPVQGDDRYYLESTNFHVNSGVSELKTKLNMKAGETLEFDFMISTERDYDFFYFYANGETVFYASGIADDWMHYVYTAPKDGEYIFTWSYIKDGGWDEVGDFARIDNIAYSGDIILHGDSNGDGIVDMADATLVMRYSLDIIEFTEEQLTISDMNGDGRVDMIDVVLIMRYAQGLNG